MTISQAAQDLMAEFMIPDEKVVPNKRGNVTLTEARNAVHEIYPALQYDGPHPFDVHNGEGTEEIAFKRIRPNWAGMEANEVFDTAHIADVMSMFNVGDVPDHWPVDSINTITAYHLGRGYALAQHGCWELLSEWDGRAIPDGWYYMGQRLSESYVRLIRVAVSLTDHFLYGKNLPEAVADEFVFDAQEWRTNASHGACIQATLAQESRYRSKRVQVDTSIGKQRVCKHHRWVTCFSKWHFLAIFLSIQAKTPIGSGVQKGIAFTGKNVVNAKQHMIQGFFLELWPLAGFDYQNFRAARKQYAGY